MQHQALNYDEIPFFFTLFKVKVTATGLEPTTT